VAVYVDNLRPTAPSRKWPFKWACHLWADHVAEQHNFASQLGLKREWFQNHPDHPHYDLTAKMRLKAIRVGAIEWTPDL